MNDTKTKVFEFTIEKEEYLEGFEPLVDLLDSLELTLKMLGLPPLKTDPCPIQIWLNYVSESQEIFTTIICNGVEQRDRTFNFELKEGVMMNEVYDTISSGLVDDESQFVTQYRKILTLILRKEYGKAIHDRMKVMGLT